MHPFFLTDISGFASAIGYSAGMKPFLVRWLVTTVAVMVTVEILPGIRYDTLWALVITSLLLGILNAFVRPMLLMLSLPLILVTLGIFILVINAFMLWIVAGVVAGFYVDNFTSAFFGAIIIGIVSWILSAFFRGSDGRYYTIAHHQKEPRQVKGRVIDV